LNKYPQLFEINSTLNDKSANFLKELREKYTKNIKISVQERFLKTLDGIENTTNYFIIFESYLTFQVSDSRNDESNKGKQPFYFSFSII